MRIVRCWQSDSFERYRLGLDSESIVDGGATLQGSKSGLRCSRVLQAILAALLCHEQTEKNASLNQAAAL